MVFKDMIKKAIASSLGLIFILLALEIALRIIGIINLRKSGTAPTAIRYSGTYIILCLGDSWTGGIGAPEGKDYPSQLEAMLNTRYPQKKFKVINYGRGSYNTTQVLTDLQNTLKSKIKPDLVILLCGDANFWNYWGYHTYLEGQKFSALIQDYLYRIRIYKLFKLLFMNLRAKFTGSAIPGEVKNNFIKEVPPIMPESECYKKGLLYLQQGDYDQAAKWFRKGIEINPEDVKCYCEVTRIYVLRHEYNKADEFVAEAIGLCPKYRNNFIMNYMLIRDYEGKKAFLDRLSKKCLLWDDYIAALKNMETGTKEKEEGQIKRWIISDTEKMIKICRDNNIKIILQNYAKNVNRQKEANNISYNIAKNNLIPFVDNFGVFLSLKNAKGSIDEYFTPDGGHPNSKGYMIMAENILNKIAQSQIFGLK